MKIAIHAADLDHDRIDGTRVYMWNMLKHFGEIDSESEFLLYHGEKFNPRLVPVSFKNYVVRSLGKALAWTQTNFVFALKKDKPDLLWMPVQNIPFFKSKKLQTTVTIHDLAFKYFPKFFPFKDRFKLNLLAKISISRADRIIAVSESTKNDILKFYPKISEEKITVVHHGFDKDLFERRSPALESEGVLKRYDLVSKKYLLYVGAIQPRKNLILLIEAFEKIKTIHSDFKLVLAGAPAWREGGVLKRIEESVYKNDIVITGTIPFEHQPALYQHASVFVFPSMYEGFGIPVLEAFASQVPVVCASNSSLPEVAGEAALFFQTHDKEGLTGCIKRILDDENLRSELCSKGIERLREFSWEKCAKKTLEVIKKD